MAGISPTQRSLKHLRANGYLVSVVERYCPFGRVRQDLYGMIDLLAVQKGQTVGIQTTTASNFAARRKKIKEHENLPMLLAAGWKIIIHGWRKDTKGKWVLKEEIVSQTHLFETTENH